MQERMWYYKELSYCVSHFPIFYVLYRTTVRQAAVTLPFPCLGNVAVFLSAEGGRAAQHDFVGGRGSGTYSEGFLANSSLRTFFWVFFN